MEAGSIPGSDKQIKYDSVTIKEADKDPDVGFREAMNIPKENIIINSEGKYSVKLSEMAKEHKNREDYDSAYTLESLVNAAGKMAAIPNTSFDTDSEEEDMEHQNTVEIIVHQQNSPIAPLKETLETDKPAEPVRKSNTQTPIDDQSDRMEAEQKTEDSAKSRERPNHTPAIRKIPDVHIPIEEAVIKEVAGQILKEKEELDKKESEKVDIIKKRNEEEAKNEQRKLEKREKMETIESVRREKITTKQSEIVEKEGETVIRQISKTESLKDKEITPLPENFPSSLYVHDQLVQIGEEIRKKTESEIYKGETRRNTKV
ncbi:hypothetical protein JTB14_009328 [Gonioctena quinquepunctata]|nr:hypothetical protein JTB14_009328 [Gonioctena quinquepunctata]